nr:MAG TPA: hypothetical protein [Caudoviricetes sp.]
MTGFGLAGSVRRVKSVWGALWQGWWGESRYVALGWLLDGLVR